jgi:hypothetical protein
MFATAEQFRSAADILMSGLANRDQSAWVALLSCEAFALELYFKCLAVQEGKAALPTHNLLRLFKVLNGKTQSEMRKRSEAAAMAAAKQLGKNYDFEKVLQASKDAFETVRYIYEGTVAGEGWMCSGIMRFTRALIVERNPSWDPSYLQLPIGLLVVAHPI